MSHIHIQYFKTGIGEFILGSFEGQLCLLDYRYRKMRQAVDALAIVIPCYRIVGGRGELVGYSGGLAVKRRLLQLEQGSSNFFEI